MKSNRLVFFGNERLATGVTTTTPVIKALISEGYEIAAVVANYKQGQGRNSRELEIAEVAKEHNIPLLLPDKPIDIKDQLISYNADFGVLAAYGKIIPASIIDIFPKGIVNIHPSLLPKYRGSTPIESVILNCDSETGVSIMSLVTKMDAGPVYAQEKLRISEQESKQEITDKLAALGKDLLISNLPNIINGQLVPKNQNENEATFTRQLSKQDGQLDLSKSAEILEREIRAFSHFPKSRLTLFNNSVVVLKARVAQYLDDGKLVVPCNNSYLEVLELVAPSGKTMSGHNYLLGYKK